MPRNPFEFGLALRFGALLAAVILLSHALQAQFGAAGLYALAAASGLADVDALALAASRQAGAGLDADIAVAAVLLAVLSNTVSKAAFALHLGSTRFAARVAVLTAPPIALAVGLYAVL